MNQRWTRVLTGVIVYMCLGTVYSWSVFREPLVRLLDVPLAATATPYAVFLALFAFSMPLGGAVLRALGPQRTLLVGAVLVGGGWAGASLASGVPGLVLSYGIIGGLGVGMSYGVPLYVVNHWFDENRGLALGITLTGFGLSPFVTAPLAELLISRSGVSASFAVLGTGFALVLVLGSLLLSLPADDRPTVVPGEQDGLGPATMVRTPLFWVLWICFALGTFSGLTAIGMSAAYGVEVTGLATGAAAAAVAGFGVCNGVGRPLFGWLTDRMGLRRVGLLAFMLIAAGCGVLLLAGDAPAGFLVGFGMLWLMLGGWLAIAPAATARLFGRQHYSTNYGIVYTAYGVGALSGNGVSGYLQSATGSLTSTFWAILIVCVLGLLLVVGAVPATVD